MVLFFACLPPLLISLFPYSYSNARKVNVTSDAQDTKKAFGSYLLVFVHVSFLFLKYIFVSC